MTFHWPWSLCGLAVVAGVALWALFRPGRQLVVVGSLSLWRKALDALDRSARRRSRFVSAAWLLLLAGATAAVLAVAGPVYHARRPVRRVAVEVLPSAEIATPRAMGQLRDAVATLLGRMNESDEVELILPALLGGGEQLSPDRARSRAADLAPVPVPAAKLDVPRGVGPFRRTYRFAAAGAASAGTAVSLIEIPTDLPPVTVDAVAAHELPDGRMQLFLALKNRGPDTTCLRRSLFLRGPGGEWTRGEPERVVLAGGRRAEWIETHPRADAVGVIVTCESGSGPARDAAAFLVRRSARVRRVAMLGPDEPLVLRFLRADPGVEFVADVGEADLVVANGVRPPSDKPSLAINPPSPPPGWRRGRLREATVLDKVHLAADDPVMQHVNLAGVAVRRLVTWVPGESAGQVRLAVLDAEALILRSAPGATVAGTPRRIYVAFDMGGENTNFAMTDAFVILLANAMRWLAPGGAGHATYEYETPLQAGPQPDWKPVGPAGFGGRRGPLPAPGIHRDTAGRLHAVCLPGLRAGGARGSPVQAAAEAPLPDPERLARGFELWGALAVAAAALWLIGWAVRFR